MSPKSKQEHDPATETVAEMRQFQLTVQNATIQQKQAQLSQTDAAMHVMLLPARR